MQRSKQNPSGVRKTHPTGRKNCAVLAFVAEQNARRVENHCSAGNGVFPTPSEMILSSTSSLAVSGGGESVAADNQTKWTTGVLHNFSAAPTRRTKPFAHWFALCVHRITLFEIRIPLLDFFQCPLWRFIGVTKIATIWVASLNRLGRRDEIKRVIAGFSSDRIRAWSWRMWHAMKRLPVLNGSWWV